MPAINFTLSGLDQSFTLGVSGELAGAAPEAIDASATAIYHVNLAEMKNVFRFQTDSFDVNDISDSDIKYFVFSDASNWPANLVINPANADMSNNPIFATGNGVTADKNKVKHDFVRYLALKLFNTPYGVDLFSNETALLNDLVTKGNTAHAAIKTSLDAVNTTSIDLSANPLYQGLRYATNGLTGVTNFSRELLRQMAFSVPARFATTSDVSGVQSIPFEADDSINFKVIISPAAGQQALTNVAGPFNARSYQIKLILKAEAANVAIATDELEANANSYPYHTV